MMKRFIHFSLICFPLCSSSDGTDFNGCASMRLSLEVYLIVTV